MTCLWMGETRAKTRVCCVAFFHHATISGGSSSVKLSVLGTRLSSMVPVMTEKSSAPCNCSLSESASPCKILMRVAMARAVSGWSPVTITTFTPAICALTTASATPSLGGSSMPYRPTNSKSRSGKLQSVEPVPSNFAPTGISDDLIGRRAMHNTRRACAIKSPIVASIFAIAVTSLLAVQNFKTRSGAPFSTAKVSWPFPPWMVSIHLFSELKGISNTLSYSGFALERRMASEPPWTSVLAWRMATSVGEPL
mmetsp:Transcript_88417/g.254985  ORF Transcript_88417/g.254985 Transcript_88417/m.254985 type:complete len:253 (-) Transcript_88417:1593-2351(-)